MADRVVYPAWDPPANRSLPARSYFYYLQPVGVGSAQVESLTSYLTRLAEAHNVTPNVLLNRELLWKVREVFRRHAYRDMGKPECTFVYKSHTLNGVAQRSHDWVSVLRDLTGVQSLEFLTMTAWSQILSASRLIRRYRVWCPCCYEDQRSSNESAYEPLLWSIQQVSVCPVHKTTLKDRCPHCGQALHVLSAKSRPGYCCRCQHWLGMKEVAPDNSSDAHARITAAAGIGELLSAQPNLPQTPSREHFLSNVRVCVEHLADGNMSRFAAGVGVSFDFIHDWFAKNRLLRLEHLTRLCAVVDISPVRFLNHRLAAGDLDVERIQQVLRQKTSHVRTMRNAPQVRSILQKAANSHYREELLAALIETPPPTLTELARRLGCTTGALQYRFPDLCQKLIAKLPERKLFMREQQRSVIQFALTEQPPPSIGCVAGRIGLCPRRLRALYPDLYPELQRRYHELKRRLAEEKREAFRSEIRTAVIDLTRRGINPSRKRVFACIPNPTMRCTTILDRQIAQTLLELDGLESFPSRSPQPQPAWLGTIC